MASASKGSAAKTYRLAASKRKALLVVLVLSTLALSPVFGFEVLYHYYLPSQLPNLPHARAVTLPGHALWVELGEPVGEEVAPLWAWNYFRAQAHESPGRKAAARIAQLTIKPEELAKKRSCERALTQASVVVWLTRHANAATLKQSLSDLEFFGRDAHGFSEAANAFFGKESSSLTVAQIALIAGLPQNPRRNDPACFHERAAVRRALVLNKLRSERLISEEEFSAASKEPVNAIAPRSGCPRQVASQPDE